ncbi:hypothetical protein F1C16_12755 [Hymenobacter sp. NBH84]|uniref:ArnT family glycosyltransferase n=1 Tax=Hymenobacter sp. NBH84 TaxID=2596915 RepID=UPI0016257218|nr:hypothetical protein [Hymenobacter sp. NBH84]QNE40364.1 hypothetical protein F1C16_12755 [Hymenobacter sp. NBH84]
MADFTPAKYENPSRTATLAWLLPAWVLVAAVRLPGLAGMALPDYDSVRNWQIVQELVRGDLRHLFYHASPGFYLLFAPLAALQSNFHWYLYLNVLLSTVAVGTLAAVVGYMVRLRPPETALLTLLIGTSTFLTFAARDFTMNSVMLLTFAGLLHAYYQRIQRPSRRTLLTATAWLALGLCFNYKFLFCLPILLVLEWRAADGLLRQPSNAGRVLLVLSAPYLVLGLVGWVGGLQWWRWPATYYGILFPSASNAAGRASNFRLDLLYYPHYLVAFESPVQWLGLLAFPLIFWRVLRAGWQRPNAVFYLAVWSYCFLGGFSLLLKAPRGLLFAYGLFAALGFLVLRHVLRQRLGWLTVVVGVAVLGNMIHIQQEIYAYTGTNYPAVAQWLQAHHSHKTVSTVGLSLAPYLAPDSLKSITDEKQLPTMRKRHYQYVVLDAYWRVTGIAHFDSLRRQRPLATWREPLLTAPLLFLEHSEFSGIDYPETMRRQQAAAQDTVQLAVFELNQ